MTCFVNRDTLYVETFLPLVTTLILILSSPLIHETLPRKPPRIFRVIPFSRVVTIKSSPLTSEVNSISFFVSKWLILQNNVSGMISRSVRVGLIYQRHSNELAVLIIAPSITCLRLDGLIAKRVRGAAIIISIIISRSSLKFEQFISLYREACRNY